MTNVHSIDVGFALSENDIQGFGCFEFIEATQGGFGLSDERLQALSHQVGQGVLTLSAISVNAG